MHSLWSQWSLLADIATIQVSKVNSLSHMVDNCRNRFLFVDCRRFAVKQCSRCREGITANELVMKARHLVFHLGCFTCSSCDKVLTTGDHFGISGDTVFCRQHYQLALRTDLRVADMSPSDMSPVANMSPGADMSLGYAPPGSHPNSAPLPFYNGTGAVQKGRPRKRSHQPTDLDRCDQLVGKWSVAFWVKSPWHSG